MIVVNADNSISVPDNPIIPYIEGDGIGVDISPVMISVVDAAAKAYDGSKKISWMEIYTGKKQLSSMMATGFRKKLLMQLKPTVWRSKGR